MRKIIIFTAILLMAAFAYADWDSTEPACTDTLATSCPKIQDNFKALDGTSGTPPDQLSAGTKLQYEGATDDSYETILTVTDPTADRTITLPDSSGTVLLSTDSSISVDTISEQTSDAGVTVDGCLIKDGKAADSDKLDGEDSTSTNIKPLGSWETKSSGTVYQATTDGFVCAYVHTTDDTPIIYGYTDSSNPPTTLRVANKDISDDAFSTYAGFCMPVRKGDYWKVVNAGKVYWIPLGS